MAAITSANVTLLRSWEVMDKAGVFREKSSDLAIVLSTQGGTAGDIPPSALGFAKIYWASAISFNNGGGNTNDTVGAVGVYTDFTTGLFTVSASTGAPANYTGTVYCRVTGTPKL
jgi:hypothetical protein